MKKEIKIPIYTGRLVLIQRRNLSKVSKEYGLIDVSEYDGFTFMRDEDKLRFFLVVNKQCTHSIVSHEVVHIVNMIYKVHSMELDVLNDEPQAYLTEWVTKQCYKYLKI